MRRRGKYSAAFSIKASEEETLRGGINEPQRPLPEHGLICLLEKTAARQGDEFPS